MELALSLGDTSKSFKFLDKTPKPSSLSGKDLGFCMGLGTGPQEKVGVLDGHNSSGDGLRRRVSSDHLPLQLDLLPLSPVPRRPQPPSQIRFPWLTETVLTEPGSADGNRRGIDVNRSSGEEGEEGGAISSPNSAASSFQMDFGLRSNSGDSRGSKRNNLEIVDALGASSRASDDEENGLTRKKLRLSKEQSAFLEESFKEHNTLNPKQKLALAKQLNLRPRQVEVWFQNRRARTKLKQTEVDCEYLKRCCETLTEENRRLQKELQELRALKTSQPFYMQLPATTLTMCPSCERVVTTSTNHPTTNTSSSASPAISTTNPINNNNTKSKLFPFSHVSQPQPHQTAS